MGASGTATIDFGGTPTSEASIAVTGQGSFLTTSLVEAFYQEQTTGDNDATGHAALAFLSAQPFCRAFVAGTGFTITVRMTEGVATGTFKIPWVWN